MPLGKVRTSKRSSSSSSNNAYGSTITVAVFIVMCILGVWMLTSNDVSPPEKTTHTGTTTTTARSSSSDNNNEHKKVSHAFEDTQGDLPDDAIKSDDHERAGDAAGGNQKLIHEEKSTDQKHADNNDSNMVGENGNHDEANASKDKRAAVDENPQGLQGRENAEERDKQEVSETQVSEESSMTQNQVEETTTSHHANHEVDESIVGHDSSQVEVEDATGDNHNPSNDTKDVPVETNEAKHEEKDGDVSDQTKELVRRQDPHLNPQSDHVSDQTKELVRRQEPHLKPQSDAQVKKVRTGNNQENAAESNTKLMKNEEPKEEKPATDATSGGSFPSGGENSGIPKESKESKKSWKTQADQSENQKERRKDESEGTDGSIYGYTWRLCNVTAGPDYIPCLDNEKAIKKLRSRRHFEHRERHCPEEGPTCLVPLPEGYKRSIQWPTSRDKIWYHNVPHTLLAQVKGHQNWVKVSGEFLTFPGGGTQFIHGALHYIDFLQSSVPQIAWGKHTRVVLDVGCGVASFGGFLFERDVLTMSFAPKDEHEAQVQFALERGIPAISAVMGSQRLPFPSRVFDVVHCARCRVPWHVEGGLLLLELNRVLRPGGYFIWSATPVYQKLKEDVEIWNEMSALIATMCWEVVTIKRDKINSIGAAIYRKPTTNECYDKRKQNRPPMCQSDDDANAAWYVPLQACMHRVPVEEKERGTHWPEEWPKRVQTPPYWLNSSQMGIYGKPAPQDFATDYEHWKRVVNKLYLNGLGISWDKVRNVMDMRAVYGGFAAAMKDLKIWVMNVVNVNSPDTLPIIYERGMFGIYHDWCESFSTYPRSYDLLHADHLFSILKKRCKLAPVLAEVDRMLRPGGKFIVRDESPVVGEVENLLKSLHWEVHLTFSKDQEGILSAQKLDWRPKEYYAASS